MSAQRLNQPKRHDLQSCHCFTPMQIGSNHQFRTDQDSVHILTTYCSISVVEPAGLKFHCCLTISVAGPPEEYYYRRVNSCVRSQFASSNSSSIQIQRDRVHPR